MRERVLKVAIVGCGKIADSHASQIRRIKGCEIVGVCDREPLMAQQLFKRFPIKQYFGSFTNFSRRPGRMLSTLRRRRKVISIWPRLAWNGDATSMWKNPSPFGRMKLETDRTRNRKRIEDHGWA